MMDIKAPRKAGRPTTADLDSLALQAGVDRKEAGRRGVGWLQQKISGRSRAEFKLEQRVRTLAEELREARDMLIEFRMRKYRKEPQEKLAVMLGQKRA